MSNDCQTVNTQKIHRFQEKVKIDAKKASSQNAPEYLSTTGGLIFGLACAR